MHGRTADYLDATGAGRAAIVATCRSEATVHDLAERILSRTIYAQSSSRVGPLRELVQNALDASPRGGRIDVRSSGGERPAYGLAVQERDTEITVSDHGRGMSRSELLEDLLVPFRSGKESEPDAIGEHGIGFLSALEIAPRIEITSVTRSGGHRLRIAPVGERAPYADFTWSLSAFDAPAGSPTGTTVRLTLEQPIFRAALVAEISAAVSLVDTAAARIFVNDALINTARLRLRKVARAPIGAGGELGELTLLVGRGEGIPPQLMVAQGGLLVMARRDAFAGPSLSLHREIARAIMAAGYGLVAELPLAVPLNKGRSAVAALAAPAVSDAIVSAFERFVLEDALYDRELLRSVDHRLSSVLDRLVSAALAGENLTPAPSPAPGEDPASMNRPRAYAPSSTPGGGSAEGARTPTVAAPEEVVRFADALLDRPMFTASVFEGGQRELRQVYTLRSVLQAYRADRLRPIGDGQSPGMLYLSLSDPLSQSLWRRLHALHAAAAAAPNPRVSIVVSMPRVSREEVLSAAIPGVNALAAAMAILEQIDWAISAAGGLVPSPVSVHQNLYGPDEMAHTDGTGISVNLASPRIRSLLCAVLADDDAVAFGALVDLLLHEKTHVSLASYVPRPTAEHGATFYRRKDWLRRRLLEAIAQGDIADPIGYLRVARRGLGSVALPTPELLAHTFSAQPIAA